MSRHTPVIEPDVRQLSQLQTGSTDFSLRMTIQRFSSCEKRPYQKREEMLTCFSKLLCLNRREVDECKYACE